ncbi:MAG TPA: hypothetical protein EYH30_10125 [Anaerolineales bacterium]|nr:hypothetical protein [Anaerolineae bacterium]HIQ02461.1 hypothetical protein [Anaerolineales bacterium]
MENMDLSLEEMEEVEEGDERQNRTFILLVGIMGGLLLIGIIAFCAWVLLVGRGMIGGQAAIPPTATVVEGVAAAEATATAEAITPPEVTPEATETEAAPSPTPTATSRPSPSPTPTPEATRPGTPVGAAQVTPTIGPARTPRPTTPTITRTPATASAPAETGIGAFTAVILATGLLLLLIVARRLRTAH